MGDNKVTWIRLLWQFISEVKNNVLFHLCLLDHAEILSISFEPLHVLQKPTTVSKKLYSPLLLGDEEVNCATLGTRLDHKLGRYNNMTIEQRKQATIKFVLILIF